jgi:hypothetical protein
VKNGTDENEGGTWPKNDGPIMEAEKPKNDGKVDSQKVEGRKNDGQRMMDGRGGKVGWTGVNDNCGPKISTKMA